jgi:hypothetical protein
MKNILSKYHYEPTGATSLLIVVAISLVLIVIVTGLTTLSIRESQQALSNDLSNRALAAAESEVRASALELAATPSLTDTDCSNENPPRELSQDTNPSNDAYIVCRTIESTSTVVEREVEKDESSLIFEANSNSNLNLYWGTDGNGTISDTTLYPSSISSTTPAMLEVVVYYWSAAGGATINPTTGISTKSLLIPPTTTPRDYSPSATTNNASISSNTCGTPTTTGTNTYYCKLVLNLGTFLGSTTQNVVVQLRPRYKLTNFNASFISGGTALTVRPNTAAIDVTAKVGDFYRRVRAEKSLVNNSFVYDVLYSRSSICKNLQAGSNYELLAPNSCS